MKIKRNKLFIIKILLLELSLIICGCEQDNLPINIENNKTNTTQKIAISKALQEITRQTNNSNIASKQQNIFNQINTNVFAYKTLLDNNTTSYSFLLNPQLNVQAKNNSLYFDNLFITIYNNQKYTHVLRYIPSKEWLNSSRSLRKYSGEIQYLSSKRIVVSSIMLENGTPIETSKKEYKSNFKARGGCQLIYKMTVCGALEGDGLSCTHFYEIQCGGSGGSNGNSSDNSFSDGETESDFSDLIDENEVVSGGGSSNLPQGRNSFTGVPIIGFCPNGTPANINGNCSSELEDQIINNLTGKAKCIFDKLTGASTDFKNMIKQFDGDFPVSHLKFSIDNTLPNGNYGITNPPKNFIIEINFSNTQLANISDSGSVVSFAHEVIHAEIFRKMLSAAEAGNLDPDNMTQQQQVNYINSLRNNFPGIYDYYINRYKPTWNHNLMAQHYISTIADIVQQYDNNSLTRQVYEDIAWAGLRIINNPNTNNSEISIAWNNLSSNEKSRINSNISNYFTNGTKNCN